jgi:hypothetical protein
MENRYYAVLCVTTRYSAGNAVDANFCEFLILCSNFKIVYSICGIGKENALTVEVEVEVADTYTQTLLLLNAVSISF